MAGLGAGDANAMVFNDIIFDNALDDFVEDISDALQASDGAMALIKNPA